VRIVRIVRIVRCRWHAQGVVPMKPHRCEAFGGTRLPADGNPLDGQGRFLPHPFRSSAISTTASNPFP
jgi:hypothetical protein